MDAAVLSHRNGKTLHQKNQIKEFERRFHAKAQSSQRKAGKVLRDSTSLRLLCELCAFA
jgi:hypothetical protein